MNVLIKTTNSFLRNGLENLLIANTVSTKPTFINDSLNMVSCADVIFIHLQPGDIYLCHEEMKTRKQSSLLFFIIEHSTAAGKHLYPCIKNASFIDIGSKIEALAALIMSINVTPAVTDTMEYVDCAKCTFRHLTPSQLLIAYALKKDFTIVEISRSLNISPATTFAQIHRIKKNFCLRNNYELMGFVGKVSLKCNVPLRIE